MQINLKYAALAIKHCSYLGKDRPRQAVKQYHLVFTMSCASPTLFSHTVVGWSVVSRF